MRGQMSRFGFYADFLVFPLVLVGVIVWERFYGGNIPLLAGTVAVFSGIFVWTFLEYAIHRFVLHNGLVFSEDHDKHHAAPKALIGTPTWLTTVILTVCIYMPAVFFLGSGLGLAFSWGVTFGYLVYSFAHYGLHHWDLKRGDFLYKWKRMHALHHFAENDGNFGVTSAFWDHVFGTVAQVKDRSLVR